MAVDPVADRRVTLSDVMIGLTEFAVLLGLLTAAMRNSTTGRTEPPVAAVAFVTFVASLPLAGAWWLAVRFANETGRRGFWERLAAHLLSVFATTGLIFATLLSCGLPAFLALAWWCVQPTDQGDEGRAAGGAE